MCHYTQQHFYFKLSEGSKLQEGWETTQFSRFLLLVLLLTSFALCSWIPSFALFFFFQAQFKLCLSCHSGTHMDSFLPTLMLRVMPTVKWAQRASLWRLMVHWQTHTVYFYILQTPRQRLAINELQVHVEFVAATVRNDILTNLWIAHSGQNYF